MLYLPAILLVLSHASAQDSLTLGPTAYTAAGIFPTSLFESYYNNPTQTIIQVQPVITDSVLNITYGANLTNPGTISNNDTADPIILPLTSANLSVTASEALYQNVTAQIMTIVTSNTTSNCTKCINALVQSQRLALQAPQLVPRLLVNLCNYYKFSNTAGCNVYMTNAQGPGYAQVLAYGNISGADGQYLCQNFISASKCPRPALPNFDSSLYWSKPKPSNATAPVPKGTDRVKVLHISDFHVDPRYATGSEANCTSGLCCRSGNPAASIYSNFTPSVPAPRFGSFLCDTPWALGAAAVQAIPVLTGTNGTGFNMTVFTGDLVSHDPYYELSRGYIEYTETALYDLWKQTLNQKSPLYAAIGNHGTLDPFDNLLELMLTKPHLVFHAAPHVTLYVSADQYQQAFDAPHNLPGALSTQLSWNYNHLSDLWVKEGWISNSTAAIAKAHYGGYSVMHAANLKVIVINTDLWYKANVFAYINSTKPDNFGFLRFLAKELQECEDNGHRAWVMGHVLSGWSGTNPLPGPSDQFYQIVDRYSHVIAGLFWGHTHEDQNMIYYANNATNASAATAQNMGWVGPSITPLTDLNSGFRLYEVDAETWDILDAHTWYSNVSSFAELDSQIDVGPSYTYEYSTREAYGANITWPENAPLNATWWHRVTENMLIDGGELVAKYNGYQGKMSSLSPNCTSEACVKAKVCYIRSGSGPIGLACPSGFDSVQ